MKKNLQKILFLNLIIFGFLSLVGVAFAQAGETVVLENPISSGTDINTILGLVIKVALGIVGSLTLVAFIYGGFLWLTSSGNQDKIKQGWNTMIYAAIGLFIIFGGYAILNTVITGIGGTATPQRGAQNCEAFGTGFACRPITNCDIVIPAGTTDVNTQREICDKSPETCRLQLCTGGASSVCCRAK